MINNATNGLTTEIRLAECTHAMTVGPVVALLIICALVVVFECLCLGDGSAVAAWFERPLLARLLLSSDGQPATSDTAPTAEPYRMSVLAAAQLALIMVGSFTLDVLFTAVATFLPGRASVRGVSGSALGAAFAAYPVGEVAAALLTPKLLAHSALDPVVGARKTMLGGALVVAIAGVIDEFAVSQPAFLIGVMATRFLQGLVSGVNEIVVNSAVFTLFGPRLAAFIASSMMAVRLLACAVGPTLGGHMYELGCWAVPFFVCACVLLIDGLLQLLVIGRRARGDLARTGKQVAPLTVLAKLSFPAIMKTIFDTVGWMHMAGLEVTLQPFFGASPYRQTPGQIGNLLLCVTLVNAIAYVAAPPLAIGVGATNVIPFAAPLCFAVSLLVGPSPWLTELPRSMGLQATAWSSSAFLFALNFPCGLVLWPSIASEMGFATEEVAGVFASMQVLSSAVGGISGPLLFAGLGEGLGYPHVYTIDAVVVFIVAEAYGLLLFHRFRRDHPPACCGRRNTIEEETGRVEPNAGLLAADHSKAGRKDGQSSVDY